MKRRDANLILVALGALGGGLVAGSLPLALIGQGAQASGLSALVPAMTPPLGGTARLLFVGGAAFLSALLTASFLPWAKRSHADGEQGETIMSFLFSKLAMFGRGRSKRGDSLEHLPELSENEAVPTLRRSDAHPDAPARAPVFARRDLGGDALPPAVDGEDEELAWGDEPRQDQAFDAREPVVRDITGLSMPRAPEPLPWDLIEQEMNRVLKGVNLDPREGDHHAEGQAPTTEKPGLKELADRLEQGLARRRARILGNAEEPATTPGDQTGPVLPEQSVVAADERAEDLEQALAALRTIAHRAD